MMNHAKEETESKSQGDSLIQQQGRPIEGNLVWPLKRFTRYKEIILNELGFEEYLQMSIPSVCVNFESGKIQGDEEEIQRATDAFVSSIYMYPIYFTGMPGIQRLFYNEEGSIEENIVLSINVILLKNKIAKYSFQSHHNVKKDDTLAAMVYCMSSDEAALAKTVLETHFCSFSLKDFSNEVKKVINEWKMKHKLVETECRDGGFTFTCTIDVKKEIEKEVNKTIKKTIPMSSLHMKYLAKQKDIIKSASKSFNTQIELDPGKYSIKLEGSFSNIKAAMNNITARMATETVSITSCPSKNLISKLDSITDEHHCMWEIKNDTNHHRIHDVQDCDHIESWYNPTKYGTFTIIEGDSFDINVDCLIVLCTDNLFPVQIKPVNCRVIWIVPSEAGVDPSENTGKDAEMLDRLTGYIGKNGGTYHVGEIIIKEVFRKRYAKEAFVVVGKSNTANKDENKNFKGLAACFKMVFKDIIKKQATSVCVPAFIQEEFLSKEIVLKAYLEATINLQKSGDALKIYLYCEKEKGVLNEDLRDTINRMYEKELGFSRIVYKQDLEMKDWKDHTDLQVEVKIEPIEKMRTEVIVNTTSTKLDLTRGIVSKRLLELAGKEMQEYCTAHYRDGIDFTTVAVTDAYGLTKVNKHINHVFHGALPGFRRDKYIQAVKTFMRCCLSEADKRKCKSIAFPALGTGNLSYPIRQVAKAMFDAVEEYGKEAVSPCVQRVVFSLYKGDTDVCQVFGLEEQDRIKNRSNEKDEYRKDHNERNSSGNRHLRGEIVGYMHPVEIIVGIRNSNEIPSTCLEIKIFSSEDAYLKLKYRNESPQSMNDHVIVSGGSKDKGLQPPRFLTRELVEEGAYKRAISDAVRYCLKNNTAEIAVDICEGPQSIDVDTKLTIIAATIEKCLPTQTMTQSGLFVLHTVYVYIQDTDQYENVENIFLRQGPLQRVKNLLNSVNPKGSNVKWEVINTSSKDTRIKVQIIGDTKESVQRAKQRVVESINSTQSKGENAAYSEYDADTDVDANWYNKNQGARPKNSGQQLRTDSEGYLGEEISGKAFWRDKRQDAHEKEVINGRIFQDSEKPGNANYTSVDENLKVEVFNVEISADMNKGYILFKEKFNDLQRWTSLVEKVYNVQLGQEQLHDESVVFKVRGKYQQVMKFKFYLDKIFPLDPEDITREKLLKSKVTDTSHTMEEIPMITKQISNEDGMILTDDYYKTDETIILPGNEMESLFFWNRIEAIYLEDITEMKYGREEGGLVLRFVGRKDRQERLKKEHVDFMNNLYKTSIELKGEDQMLKAIHLVEGILSNNDDVRCKVIQENYTIYLVSISKDSLLDVKMKILKHLEQVSLNDGKSTSKSTENLYKQVDLDESTDNMAEYGKAGKPPLPQRKTGYSTLTGIEQFNKPSSYISVQIYRCAIQDINADYLIVPYLRHHHKLSERVFTALGNSIREELEKSVSQNGSFQSCECRVTCGGRLDSCKIIHMCLDEDQKSRQVTGKLLQNALTKALWMGRDAATVTALLTGISDESNFNYTHAEQFFDSICEFSKERQGVHVSKINLISHIEDYVKCAAQTFSKMAERNDIKIVKEVSCFLFPKHVDDKEVKQLPEVEMSSKTIPGHFMIDRRKVKVMIDKGDVAAVSAKGVVCIQDIDLSCSGESAHNIHVLCGDDYRKSNEESRNKKWDAGDILALPTKGGSITVQYVINVFLPERKEGDYDSFSIELQKITKKILQESDVLNLKHLAMPFLQPGEEDQLADIQFIRACCQGMATGIIKFFNDNKQCCFDTLEILVKDEGILEELKREFKRHLQHETTIS